MISPNHVIATAHVERIEQQTRHLPKSDWYQILDIMIDELQLLKDACADDLRADGINPQDLLE